jgi:hypothetical protein
LGIRSNFAPFVIVVAQLLVRTTYGGPKMSYLAERRLLGAALIFGAALVATVGPALAEKVNFRAMMESDTQETIEQLNLTSTQKTEVKPILDGAITQRMAVFEAYRIKPGEPPPPAIATLIQVQGRMDDIRTAVHTELTPILKPDQLTKADELDEQFRQKYRNILLGR